MKGRKGKAGGGESMSGVDDAKKDLDTKPEARTNAKKIDSAAEERKAGGRVGRKHGGVVHREAGKDLGHAKHVGMVHGDPACHSAGRKVRKSGGRAGSNMNPLSSAHKGSKPKGHSDIAMD